MRLFLASLVLVIGAAIGVNAINTVEKMQNDRMQRLCNSLPTGASYDEMCRDFNN